MVPLCLHHTVSLLDGETGSGSGVPWSLEYLPAASLRDLKHELGLLRKCTVVPTCLNHPLHVYHFVTDRVCMSVRGVTELPLLNRRPFFCC